MNPVYRPTTKAFGSGGSAGRASRNAQAVCMTFANTGRCQKGTSCQFSHDKSHSRLPQRPISDSKQSSTSQPQQSQHDLVDPYANTNDDDDVYEAPDNGASTGNDWDATAKLMGATEWLPAKKKTGKIDLNQSLNAVYAKNLEASRRNNVAPEPYRKDPAGWNHQPVKNSKIQYANDYEPDPKGWNTQAPSGSRRNYQQPRPQPKPRTRPRLSEQKSYVITEDRSSNNNNKSNNNNPLRQLVADSAASSSTPLLNAAKKLSLQERLAQKRNQAAAAVAVTANQSNKAQQGHANPSPAPQLHPQHPNPSQPSPNQPAAAPVKAHEESKAARIRALKQKNISLRNNPTQQQQQYPSTDQYQPRAGSDNGASTGNDWDATAKLMGASATAADNNNNNNNKPSQPSPQQQNNLQPKVKSNRKNRSLHPINPLPSDAGAPGSAQAGKPSLRERRKLRANNQLAQPQPQRQIQAQGQEVGLRNGNGSHLYGGAPQQFAQGGPVSQQPQRQHQALAQPQTQTQTQSQPHTQPNVNQPIFNVHVCII